MRSYHSLPISRVTVALVSAAVVPASIHARPGGLISEPGSVVERPGEVLAASLTDEGSVTLAGLFSRVNGVSAPGIVRLKLSGEVDGSFTAGIGISPPATVPGPGSTAAMVVPCPVFQLIDGGGVMIGDPPMVLRDHPGRACH